MESDTDIEAAHEELVRGGILAPVELGAEDETRWRDCDLASFAENRIGDRTDPRTLGEVRRQEWLARAVSEPPCSLEARDYERCYWVLDGEERTGTIALARSSLGGTRVRVSSLYTYPTYRRRGHTRRALVRIREVLASRDLGIKLDTEWCWQSTVRWYLHIGMWVRMWKRSLEFQWDPGIPAPSIDVGANHATLGVVFDDVRTVLVEARREADRLVFEARKASEFDDARLKSLAWEADSTLALALALYGWPLLRSSEDEERFSYADAGPPEALARKIVIWEAWDRKHQYSVDTPRIPGLAYPSWEELQAQWEAKSKARFASDGV